VLGKWEFFRPVADIVDLREFRKHLGSDQIRKHASAVNVN